MANPTPISPSTPQLLDAALSNINSRLQTSLTWLTNTYGKAQAIPGYDAENRPKLEPGIYVSGRLDLDYLLMWPDASLGNFSFWDVDQEQNIEQGGDGPRRYFPELVTTAGLILWGDFRTVFPAGADQDNTIENIKRQVWDAFQRRSFPGVRVKATKFYERSDQIYKRFTHKEIEHQFLIRPYWGLRLDVELRVLQKC